MLKKLLQPYPIDTSIRHNLVIASSFGLFIFLFNLITDTIYKDHSLLESLVPAIVTFLVLSFNFILIPRFFSSQFNEDKWTVGREIGWSLMQFICIGSVLFLYHVQAGDVSFSIKTYSIFIAVSFAIGTAPVIGIVMYEQNRLLKKNLKAALSLNQQLAHPLPTNTNKHQEFVLLSDNEKEKVKFEQNQLILISSADNYVEVFLEEDGQVQKHILRSSLKRIANQLQHNNHFFRCHRAHLINIKHIESVTGNAQGYKVKLTKVEEVIPVSRSQTKTFKLRLNTTF